MATLWFPLIFLFGSCILMAVKTSVNLLKQAELGSLIDKCPREMFVFTMIDKLFSKEKSAPFTDFFSLTGLICLIAYGVASTIFLISNDFLSSAITSQGSSVAIAIYWFILTALILSGIALFSYAIFHLFASHLHIATIRLMIWIATIYLLILFPLTYPIIWVERFLFPDKSPSEPKKSTEKLKGRLMEIINDDDFIEKIDTRDKRLLKSLAHFGDLSAREVMVPRIDIECIPNTSKLEEALDVFVKEGYSRVPVFKESVDNMVGVLLLKDVVEHCFHNIRESFDTLKNEPISSLINPILFSPENKYIRDLFQEMRQQKTHISIVVNEYGVTEGLVTIEDILEELVGSEILDEHDDEDEDLLYEQSNEKEWFVEARMSILDAEKEFDVKFPHDKEYETIAGFICKRFGAIPPPDTIIHHDNLIIRVLESDSRQIHKVKITKQSSDS